MIEQALLCTGQPMGNMVAAAVDVAGDAAAVVVAACNVRCNMDV